ncbi:cytochrome c oxidase subunit 2A [Brevibacillus humidisoli]|nr:cytochrome c oxidase subunit 2A [Brevibacillus humidisoli]UFJ41766.1 cytochrome c oxidase subunit 2A [Brevibacillus humidisoli]
MKNKREDSRNLKGTLLCVFALGLLILASWFGMLAIYLSRQ